jgi:hypothetical protein
VKKFNWLELPDEHLGGHSAPDLRLHRVLVSAHKSLDAQVLFDPLEEQLEPPAILVQGGNRQRWQTGNVGQKDQGLALFEYALRASWCAHRHHRHGDR